MPQSIKDILSAPIPLSVVMFLVVQTMGFVWWASAQVNVINLRLAATDMKVDNIVKFQDGLGSHEGRLIVLEQVAGRVRDDLQEIKVMLRNKQGLLDDETSPQQRPAN